MVVKLKTPLFLFPLVVGNKIREESFSNNAFCQGFLSLRRSSRIQHQQNMLDHVLVWKQREKSIHFTRVRLWDSRLLLLYYHLLSSQMWGTGKDCEGLGELPRKEWRDRVYEQRIHTRLLYVATIFTYTVKISEVEPKPQIQFCFSANYLA